MTSFRLMTTVVVLAATVSAAAAQTLRPNALLLPVNVLNRCLRCLHELVRVLLRDLARECECTRGYSHSRGVVDQRPDQTQGLARRPFPPLPVTTSWRMLSTAAIIPLQGFNVRKQ